MTGADRGGDVYVLEHVREALATDPRTSAQGLEVAHDGDTIVVAGTVASVERRDAVGEVASDVAAPLRIVNRVVVLAPTDGHETEELG